jgi:thiamine pyrophosphokinase
MAQPSSPFVVLLGGTLTVTPRLGVIPELWVGDFDSASEALQAKWQNVSRIAFDPAKAKSDGALAIEEAIRRGANSLILVGAFGGSRSDHQLIIVTQAAALAATGVPVILSSGTEEAIILTGGEVRIDLKEGTVFSVVALNDLKGLSITNARWPLSLASVPFGSTMTLSNIALGRVLISLISGTAMIMSQVGESVEDDQS